MRGRTSLRAAAVLMAGLISASLVAPGLASAQTDQASCVSGGGAWVAGDCVAGAGTPTTGSAGTGSTAGDGGGSTTGATGGTTGSTPSTGTATTPPVPSTGTGTTGNATGTTGDPADTGSAGTTTGTVGTSGATATAPKAVATQALADGVVDEADAAKLGALVQKVVPAGTPLTAPAVDTSAITAAATPAETCTALFGSVPVPANLGGALAGGVSQLCSGVSALDPATLTGLIGNFTDLLKKLAASLPKPPSTIPSTPPQGTPDHFKGWWNKHHDIDCGDVSYDEAQAILRLDRSDPFNLDGNDDGEACERNAKYVECWDDHDHSDHDKVIETVEYEGYPVGGVSTGDSDPATDAAPVAASALGLVMTAGLASVAGARHRRDDDADERDDADDLDVPQAV